MSKLQMVLGLATAALLLPSAQAGAQTVLPGGATPGIGSGATTVTGGPGSFTPLVTTPSTTPGVVGAVGTAGAPGAIAPPGVITAPGVVGAPGILGAPGVVGVSGTVAAPGFVATPGVVAAPGLVGFGTSGAIGTPAVVGVGATGAALGTSAVGAPGPVVAPLGGPGFVGSAGTPTGSPFVNVPGLSPGLTP